MSQKPSALPIVLLAAMTTATLVGPLAFGVVLHGGARDTWPPDRPIEWWALGLTSALVVALMVGTILVSLATRKPRRPSPPPPPKPDGATGPRKGPNEEP
jgi:hypothetical protein